MLKIEFLWNRLLLLFGRLHYLSAKLWGIKLGLKCQFYGRTHFHKCKVSTIEIGSNCRFRSTSTSNWIGVNRPCMISTHRSDFAAMIEIGRNCGFSGTVIGAFKYIKIGDNVQCGANSLITDSDWHLNDYRSGSPEDVIIEDNVWIGVSATILKGVTIGKNAIIGANSVVTKSIPANAIAAGNPCKVIRILE